MINSAHTRRNTARLRIHAPRHRRALVASRRGWDRLAHPVCMDTTTPTLTGLEPVLTTSQLAAHLDVPVQTLHDLRHAGRGPRGFRVGKQLHYRLSEIERWIATLEDAADTSAAEDGAER